MGNKLVVVNFFAGPGTGKSSSMADLFSKLKWKGVNCEQAPEFAKEKVWEESIKTLGNQMYVFGKQMHILWRLRNKVDVAITDSPLLLSIMYGAKMDINSQSYEHFREMVLSIFNHEFDNINIFLRRKKKFNPNGRLQNEQQAKDLDRDLRDILDQNAIQYYSFEAGPDSIHAIEKLVIEKIGEDKLQYS